MFKLFSEREIGHKNMTKIEDSLEDYLANMPFKKQIKISCPGTRCTYNLCTSKDGKYLASLHGNHSIVILEVIGMKPLTILTGHPRSPWSAAFHPLASNVIVTGCIAGHVIIWKIDNINRGDSQIIGRFVVGDNNAVSAVTFHSSGKYFLFSSENYVYYWNLQNSAPTNHNSYSHKIKYLKFAMNDTCLLIGFKLPRIGEFHVNNRLSNELTGLRLWCNQLVTCLQSNWKEADTPKWDHSQYIDVRSMIKSEMSIESMASVMTAYFSNQNRVLGHLISKYHDEIFVLNSDEMFDASPTTLKACSLVYSLVNSYIFGWADSSETNLVIFLEKSRVIFDIIKPPDHKKKACEPFVETYLNLVLLQDVVQLLMPMLVYIERFPLTDDIAANAEVEKALDEYDNRSSTDFLIMLYLLQYTIVKISLAIDCNIKPFTKSLAEYYLRGFTCKSRYKSTLNSISRLKLFQIAALEYSEEDFFIPNRIIEFNSKDAVVPVCNLNNSTGVSVSDGPECERNFVAAILPNNMIGVYSLDWSSLGHWMYKFRVDMSPIALALSPSNRYLMIACRSTDSDMRNKFYTFAIDHIYFRYLHEFSSDYKVNTISFLRSFAEGLVVGVNHEGIIYCTFSF